MKNIKSKVLPVFMVMALVFAFGGFITSSVSATQNKVNICHENGQSGTWNVLNVDENGWEGHDAQHPNDFLYEGPDDIDDDWCENPEGYDGDDEDCDNIDIFHDEEE